MKTISLKIDDNIFSETEEILETLKKPRNRYINEAIKHYNRKLKRTLIKKTLELESKLIKDDSLNVLREFDDVEYED